MIPSDCLEGSNHGFLGHLFCAVRLCTRITAAPVNAKVTIGGWEQRTVVLVGARAVEAVAAGDDERGVLWAQRRGRGEGENGR